MTPTCEDQGGDHPVVAVAVGVGAILAVVGLLAGGLVAVDNGVGHHQQCATNCHPHVSQIISGECNCAVDNGWIGVVEFNNTRLLGEGGSID